MGVMFLIEVGIGIMIFALLLFGAYVLDSILKCKLFTLFGTCNPVFGWIPFYSSYLLGKTCTGRDGQQTGLFGVVLPNWVWEFGWVVSIVIFVVCIALRLSSLLYPLQFVANAAYYSFLWSFFYSRLEGRHEPEIRGMAILSGVVGVVALVKILSTPQGNVYSLQNDVYPMETTEGKAEEGFGDYFD